MIKRLILNQIALAVSIGVVLLATVLSTGCSTPEVPPAYLLQWGSTFITSGNGQLDWPSGVAVDATTGNIYVADTQNSRIQKFDSNGTYLAQWGSYGTGNAKFNFPYAVAVDATGNVYVADTFNQRIQKFNSNGIYLAQWGGYGTGNKQFNNPSGVAVDATGNVYVADSLNNRIQKFDTNGIYLGQWGVPGSGNKQFNQPDGVAVDATGKVYVADSDNNRIQKFDSNGVYLIQWGVPGSGNGQFNYPHGVAVDATGKVYVADLNNNRIQKFDSNGAYLTQWGIYGNGNGQFNQPEGVAVAGSNVYVADTFNSRIQKFGKSSSPGRPTIPIGTATLAPTGLATRVPSFGTINVNATLDGVAWTGLVTFTVTGTSPFSGASVPLTSPNMPVGTYTIAYNSGGPSGASFVGITPTGPQTLTDGGTITFTLNFATKIAVRTGTIIVNATLDGVAWPGAVSFNLSGPSPFSGTAVPLTSPNMPVGSYILTYLSGGPSGASFGGITASATQTLNAGGTITYTLNFRTNKVDTGTVNINATLDGVSWPGAVSFTMTGPSPFSGSSVPLTSPNMPVGSYTLTYLSGGPSGASFGGITPSATQTLAAGGTITFTINFTTKIAVRTGTIIVNATLDGVAWPGSVNFTMTGTSPFSGSYVPQTFTAYPVGTYTLAYNNGGPSGASFVGITSSATQNVTAGGTTTFTINFITKITQTGTIIVNGAQNGVAWNGAVNYTLTQQTGGSQTYSGTAVNSTYNSAPVGNYTVTYVSGGPTGGAPTSITVSSSQPLTAGGTTVFTLNWDKVAVSTGTIIVNATIMGPVGSNPWTGTLSFTLTGPGLPTISGNSVNSIYNSVPVGNYTLTYLAGGPSGAKLFRITPLPPQTLTANTTLVFVMEFQ